MMDKKIHYVWPISAFEDNKPMSPLNGDSTPSCPSLFQRNRSSSAMRSRLSQHSIKQSKKPINSMGDASLLSLKMSRTNQTLHSIYSFSAKSSVNENDNKRGNFFQKTNPQINEKEQRAGTVRLVQSQCLESQEQHILKHDRERGMSKLQKMLSGVKISKVVPYGCCRPTQPKHNLEELYKQLQNFKIASPKNRNFS